MSRTARSGIPADTSSAPALSSRRLGTRYRAPSGSIRPSATACVMSSAVTSPPNISASRAAVT